MSTTDYDKGMANRRRVLGDAWVDKSIASKNSFNGEFQDLITRYAWNEVWGRPALGDKTRRLMVLSTMIALKAYEEFAMHVRAALDGPPESRLTPGRHQGSHHAGRHLLRCARGQPCLCAGRRHPA
jgi:4-carboxymuconolactone decarboxylase